MKISDLTIKNYKQFKDLSLELTYPKGHEKEGQPLDKICIIGQSGTGKTNLLNIIKNSVIDFTESPTPYKPFPELNNSNEDEYITNSFITKNQTKLNTLFTHSESKINYENINILENERTYFVGIEKEAKLLKKENSSSLKEMSNTDKTLLDGLNKQRKQIESLGISYYGLEKFSKEIENIDLEIAKLNEKYTKEETISETLNKFKSGNFIDRTIVNINNENTISWELLKSKIDNYQNEYTKYNNTLTNKLIENDTYSKDDYIKDIQEWKDKNANTLETISDKLNYILKKFNLELTKIDENQKNFTDLIIKDLSNDNIIDYENLSTGTKNLLSTFIPLKIYEPKDSIILIDEPEISFYPDIQKELIFLYTDIGENNQLIVATHSPIIASSFEPWEIVELKFDDDNQIYREKYYEEKDENHIDNYILDPRMLTWTGILTDIFDLKEDSNFSIREKALMEYATLKAEIKALDTQEKKLEKLPELQKLSKKLGLDS